MLDLILLRHAATQLNRQGRYQGARSDPDLSMEGAAQAKALRSRLNDLSGSCDALWTSDSRRAWRTAALALPGLRARMDSRLRELDFGVFDGLTYRENLSRFGRAFSDWLADPWNVAPPGGETLAELSARLESWRAELASAGRVIAVGHGGPIQLLVASALGISFQEAGEFNLGPGEGLRLSMNAEDCDVTEVLRLERGWMCVAT